MSRQASSSDFWMYSFARCARTIAPGPQTIAGMPAAWYRPASVP